jgi:hypothetical protein
MVGCAVKKSAADARVRQEIQQYSSTYSISLHHFHAAHIIANPVTSSEGAGEVETLDPLTIVAL